uniref:Uncharacterized protein n=1 Tax=Mycena chlorophos TaxID=658473 RepID=A0ABQ0LSB0_MYCCL|nr:predicted protein [Mycena chlorophos]
MISSPSSSTPSLVSTVSSRATLVQQPKSNTKDYSAAFASLQSTYGFGGAVPSPVSKTPQRTQKMQTRKSVFKQEAAARPIASGSTSGKNYEAAFADLQSSFGFGGPIGPSPVPKTRSRSNPRSLATPITPTPFADRRTHSGAPSPVPANRSSFFSLARLRSTSKKS